MGVGGRHNAAYQFIIKGLHSMGTLQDVVGASPGPSTRPPLRAWSQRPLSAKVATNLVGSAARHKIIVHTTVLL